MTYTTSDMQSERLRLNPEAKLEVPDIRIGTIDRAMKNMVSAIGTDVVAEAEAITRRAAERRQASEIEYADATVDDVVAKAERIKDEAYDRQQLLADAATRGHASDESRKKLEEIPDQGIPSDLGTQNPEQARDTHIDDIMKQVNSMRSKEGSDYAPL